MYKAPSHSYDEWLGKARLICQIYFHDKEINNLHVKLSEFMAFTAEFLSREDLENLLNSVKELNNKSSDVINLCLH